MFREECGEYKYWCYGVKGQTTLSLPCLRGVGFTLGPLIYTKPDFSTIFSGSIQQWRKERKKSVWMKVPIVQSYLIPMAFEHGFSYHHAVGDHAMLLKWLPKKEHNKVPPYATHQVGVSGDKDRVQRWIINSELVKFVPNFLEVVWSFNRNFP